MQSNPFEGHLERLARTLTEEYGVNVLFKETKPGPTARESCCRHFMKPMDEALERMVVGFLDHEMGHVAFSDFKVVAEFSKKHPGREVMLNVVEDALIERRLPGVCAQGCLPLGSKAFVCSRADSGLRACAIRVAYLGYTETRMRRSGRCSPSTLKNHGAAMQVALNQGVTCVVGIRGPD